MVPAVTGFGYDQPEPVVEEIRRVRPKPRPPSGIANAKRVIADVSV
jgi:hypothetical protein